MKRWISFWVLFFLLSGSAHAGLFKHDPDPDPRPNIFKRMANSVTGLFHKKKEVVEVSSTDVKAYSNYPEEEWVSSSRNVDSIPQVEEPASAPIRAPARRSSPAPAAAPQLAKAKKTAVAEEEPEESVDQYVQKLKGLILKRAKLPEEAKGTALKEKVKVYFVLDPAGGLKKVYIPEENRSSYGFINEAAMATVKEASLGFPPLPKELRQGDLQTFNIEITYEDSH